MMTKKISAIRVSCACLMILLFSSAGSVMAVSPQAQALFQQGEDLAAKGNLPAAIEALTQAVKVDPEFSEGFRKRGFLHYRLNNLDDAQKDCQRALELDPHNAMAYGLRGAIKRNRRDFTGAITDYELALKKDPGYYNAVVNIAYIKIDLGDYQGAIDQADKALTRRPGDSTALLGRGQARLLLGQLQSARSDLDQVLAKEPKNAFALTQRAIALQKLGKIEEAKRDLTLALQLKPRDPQAQKIMAELQAPGVATEPAAKIKPAVSTAADQTPSKTAALSPPSAKPVALPPRINLENLTRTEYTGAISATMESMRLLLGPMSSDEVRQFNASWSPLFQFPYPEAVAYCNRLNPLLVEFLSLRTAMAQATVDYENGWKEMTVAAELEIEEAVRAAYQRVATQARLAGSLQARLQEIADKAKGIGPPPDVEALRGKAHKRHQAAMETLQAITGGKPTAGNDLAGIWQGNIKYVWRDETGMQEIGYPGTPWLVILFKETIVIDMEKVKQNNFDINSIAEKIEALDLKTGLATYWVMNIVNRDEDYVLARDGNGYLAKSKGMSTFGSLLASDPAFRLEFGGDSAALTWLSKDPANKGESYGLARDPDFWPLPGHTEKDLTRYTATLQAAVQRLSEKQTNISRKELRELENRVNLLKDCVRDDSQYLAILPLARHVYLDRLPELEKEAKSPAHPEYGVGIWIAKESAGQVCNVFRTKLQALRGQTGFKPPAPAKVPDAPVNSTEKDQATEAREEAIAFHKENIKIIEANMARDESERARAAEDETREALDFRIRIARDNLQKERDLIASLQTGAYVHTRTEYDDYLHNQFVSNILAKQQEIAESQRDAALVNRLADVLPPGEAEPAREFIQKHITAEVLARGDRDAIEKVRDALAQKVQGYVEQSRAQQELARAERALMVLNGITTAGGVAVAIATGGMGAGPALYAGATGFLAEDSPDEIVCKAASWYSTPAFMMAEAVKGFEEGGYLSNKTGVAGAVDRVATGYVMGKAFEFGVSKIGQAWSGWAKGSAGKQFQEQLRAEYQAMRPEMERGKQLAFQLEDVEKRLMTARASGQLAATTQMEDQAFKLASELNANYYAKLFVKTRGGPGMELAAIKHVNRVYARVDGEVIKGLADRGYDVTRFSLEGVRNASNSMTLGMDRDWGLMNTPPEWATARGADGQWRMVRNNWLTQNGKPTSIHQLQKDGHEVYTEVYEKISGHNAERSFQTFTTKVHQESFRDLGVLSNLKDPTNVKMLEKTWAGQTAGTIEFKGLDMLSRQDIGTVTGYIEAGRGLAKEIDKKILPILAQSKPGKGLSVEKITATTGYLKELNVILDDMTMNRIPPWEASTRIRTLSGGKDLPEVLSHMRELLEASFQFGGIGR